MVYVNGAKALQLMKNHSCSRKKDDLPQENPDRIVVLLQPGSWWALVQDLKITFENHFLLLSFPLLKVTVCLILR